MKSWFRYVLYASLVFLAIALYKADYLVLPHIHSAHALAGSFLLLFAGLIADAFSWRTVIRRFGFPTGVGESIAAVGLSAFAKYIPGKIWAVMGRSAYIKERRGYSLTQLTSASLIWQIIMLWVGLIFGATGLFLLDELLSWGLPILIAWLALTTVIFSRAAQSIARPVYMKILKKDISFPSLPITSTLSSLPWFFITWGLLSFSFYLLVAGLTSTPVPASTGLGFSLTIIMGILAVFVPGGIGVREGAMVAWLTIVGVPLKEAAAISIAARLWFLIGEIFTFVLGMVVGAIIRKQPSDDAS
jgi:uncharacterized membrane protein YbhN (UPF0104 family)